MIKTEVWREIPGYEMLYEASSEGRIRTFEGKVTSNARYNHRVWKQRILKQKCTKNQRGRADCRVTLWKEGKSYTLLVARLIAMAFCDGYEEGMTVNHIDGNPLNNRASNLEWCTLSENIKKGFDKGLYSAMKPITIADSEGNEYKFRSLSAVNKFLGKSNGYIAAMIKRNKKQLCDGYFIKTFNGSTQ